MTDRQHCRGIVNRNFYIGFFSPFPKKSYRGKNGWRAVGRIKFTRYQTKFKPFAMKITKTVPKSSIVK